MHDDFADGLPLPHCTGVVDRRRFLPERVAGLRVLHLGCVDEHLLERRIGTEQLLHAVLTESSAEIIGVDISEEGLKQIAAVVPGTYLHGDVEQLSSLDLPEFDVVVAGEIIEHLGRPGQFLEELRTVLERAGASAIITTPNAYSWMGFARFALRRREPTHPDHVAIYSPVTLERALEQAGLEVVNFWAHRWTEGSKLRHRFRTIVDNTVLKWTPWLAVGLVVEVRARPGRARVTG